MWVDSCQYVGGLCQYRVDSISTAVQLWVVNVHIYAAHSHAIFFVYFKVTCHIETSPCLRFKVAKTEVWNNVFTEMCELYTVQ
jgi:hypothetical protein